jgi:hypothetical protein
LGVRHPDHPVCYLVGIECDGARYHSSKSARDRDRLREEVLAGLGWQLLRVWSTDWFDNPDLQTERLVKRLEELRHRPPAIHQDYNFAGVVQASPAADAERPDENQDADNRPVAGVALTTDDETASAPSGSQTTDREVGTQEQTPAGTGLLNGTEPLTRDELTRALRGFRQTVIAAEMPDWEPHRSILRDAMIETFVAQGLNDPGDWFTKVPQFLRQGTTASERTRYMDRICDLVARL